MAEYLDIAWDYWINNLPGAEPWQACALSVDIEPNSMSVDRKDYSMGPGVKAMYGQQPSQEKKNTLMEFKRRLNLLVKDQSNQKFFAQDLSGKLRLHEFVAWMKHKGISHFPLRLAELEAPPRDIAFYKETLERNAKETREAIESMMVPWWLAKRSPLPETPNAGLARIDLAPATQSLATASDADAPKIQDKLGKATDNDACLIDENQGARPETATTIPEPTASPTSEQSWVAIARDEVQKIRAAHPTWKTVAVSQEARNALQASGVYVRNGRGSKAPSSESIRKYAMKGI